MKSYLGVDGFTFGCDPEVFLVNGDGELQSGYGIIPGTKQEPFPVEKGAIQLDGMAAEINIDVAESFEDWNGNIVAVLKQLKAMLPKGWGLRFLPAARFSQQVMDAQPDTAKALGCDPDYCAWTGQVNPTPDSSVDPLLRTGAGHVHLGWTKDMPFSDTLHLSHCFDLVKQLDWFLGTWSVVKDPDVTRRSLYGKAGACRPKPYGVEYRVLSNWWLQDKETRLHVWNRMQAAVIEMQAHEYSKMYEKTNEVIQTMINTGKRNEGLEDDFRYPILTVR